MKFTDWIKLKEEIKPMPQVGGGIKNNANAKKSDAAIKQALVSNIDKGTDAQKKALKQVASQSNDPKEIAKISKTVQELD